MPTWTITVESQHIEETLELIREQGVFFETENNMTALSDLGTYATGAMGPAAVREMNEALAIQGARHRLRFWDELDLSEMYAVLEARAALNFRGDEFPSGPDDGDFEVISRIPSSAFFH